MLTPAAAVRAAVEPGRLRELLGRLPLGDHLAARARCSSSARARRSRGSSPSSGLVAVLRGDRPGARRRCAGHPAGRRRRVLRAQHPRRRDDRLRAAPVLRAGPRAGAAELAAQHRALELEQEKSERLLLNVLPAPVAARLKEHEGVIADDLPGGHRAVRRHRRVHAARPSGSPRRSSSSLLDGVFARWDALAAAHGVEKIKTIGDAYMVAGGIPRPARRPRRGDRRAGARDGPGAGARARRRPGCRCRCGSASTAARSSPA